MNTIGGFKYSSFRDIDPISREYYKLEIRRFLRPLCLEYPRFMSWYNNLYNVDGSLKKEREIKLCFYERTIVGLAILKKDNHEKKICTLRVDKRFQRNGIGRNLIKQSIEWLEEEKPLITVRKSKAPQFDKLFTSFGFTLEESKPMYYSLFSAEQVFNGELPEKNKLWINKIEIADLDDIIRKYIGEGQRFDMDRVIDAFIDRCKRRENLILQS